MNIIYKGITKVLTFKVFDNSGDPIDLSANTEIKACLNGVTYTKTGGDIVLVENHKFEVTVPLADTALLAEGNQTLVGQVEFGTASNPIEFKESVKVKNLPC